MAIRMKSLTMEKAAEILGMTRANLYTYLNKAKLDDTFVNLVNTKLDVELNGDSDKKGENGSKNDAYEKKYIALLEETVKQQREELKALHEDVKELKAGINQLKGYEDLINKNRISLKDILDNQIDIVVMNRAFHKMFVDLVGKWLDHDPKTLLRNLDKDTVENRSAYMKKGTYLETGI